EAEDGRKPVFLLPVASTLSQEEVLASGVNEFAGNLDLKLITENRYDMMAACDAALAVSGTVTLELALLDTPMVVFYKVSQTTYRLGRLFLNKDLKYFSLVNLVADDSVVAELSQENVTAANLYKELSPLLSDSRKRREMLQGLALVRARMGTAGASQKSASLALSLLD
ncbi:MAG: lipid-A-disaccharide synthase, partial [Desulfocapsa sp.]